MDDSQDLVALEGLESQLPLASLGGPPLGTEAFSTTGLTSEGLKSLPSPLVNPTSVGEITYDAFRNLNHTSETLLEDTNSAHTIEEVSLGEDPSFDSLLLGGVSQALSTEIIFVDTQIKNYQQLIGDIDPSAEVIMLSAERDGVEHISEVLAERQDISAVHILSHGSEGELDLGTSELNTETLPVYDDLLKKWRASLTADADVLFYGCNVAAGETGRAFINQIGLLTGADVSASDNLTGAAALGGDWTLEYAAGTIEAMAISSDYQGTLATELTVEGLYADWQNNSLPTPESVEIAQLAVGGIAQIDTTDLTYTEEGGQLKLQATNVNAFLGIDASNTATTADDTGVALSGAGFELTLNADGSFDYIFTNGTADFNGLDFPDTAVLSSVEGNESTLNLTLNDTSLAVDDYARLQGDLVLSIVEDTSNEERIDISVTNATALIGNGANTTETSDDIGIQIAGTTASARLLYGNDGELDSAYAIGGSASLLEVSDLDLSGTVQAKFNNTEDEVTLADGTVIAAGENEVQGTGLALAIANLTTLTTDLEFSLRESDGTLLATGNNLTADVMLNGQTGSITNGEVGLVILSDGTYALQATGDTNNSLNIAGLAFTDDLTVEVNTTGQKISESITHDTQTQTVEFSTTDAVSQFNATSLDLTITADLRTALLAGAQELIDLQTGLTPQFDDDGNPTTDVPLATSLPGTDKTLEGLLGVSGYLDLGNEIKAYLDADSTATLQELIQYIEDNWVADLAVPDGFEFLIDDAGFSIGYSAEDSYTQAVEFSLAEEALQFGLELKDNTNLDIAIALGIDFDLSFDWANFDSAFNLTELTFDASATDDLAVEAYYGSLEGSLGSTETGKEAGQINLVLGGSITHTTDGFDVATTDNTLDIDLPFYATLLGHDFSADAPPKIFLDGKLFGEEGITLTHENFDQLLNFSRVGVGDVLSMIRDLVSWAEDYADYEAMQAALPFLDLELGEALDFASAINDEILGKIDFYQPREDLLSGSSAAVTAGTLVVSGGSFTDDFVGKALTFGNGDTYTIESVTDSNTLILAGADSLTIADDSFVIHEPRELLRTYQELMVAINSSGVLPDGISLTYDSVENELILPFSFEQAMDPLSASLDLGLDLGDLSLSTDAIAALTAAVNGRIDLVIDFDGPGNDEGINLYVENVELNGTAEFDVDDLAVEASLGFVGLTAGGAGSGSGVNLSTSILAGLDRDPDNVTAGDRRFSFNDLLDGELFNAFNTDFEGSAEARLKGLSVNGGFGDISIAPDAELAVYVPNLSEISAGPQTIIQALDQPFDLAEQLASGAVANEGAIVVLPDIESLLSIKDIGFEDIISGIRAGIDFIDGSLADNEFYNTALPVINQSLSEQFAFLDTLAAQLESATANPAGTLQNVEGVIESALGLVDDNTLPADEQLFSLSLNGDYLDIHLGWQALFSENFDFALDLDTFKDLSGNAGAAALDGIDALADLNGGGGLSLEAIAQLSFDVALDLTTLTDGSAPDILLRDYDATTGKGTHAQIGARLIGENLDMSFKAGPMDIGVRGGSVVLDGDGQADTVDYAGVLISLDQQPGAAGIDDELFRVGSESIGDNFEAKLTGGFDVNLPIGLNVLGLEVNLDAITVGTNPVYGDQGLVELFKHLANSTDAGSDDPLVMTFPDIRSKFEELGGQFSLLSLINDPSFVLDGVDLAVGTLQDVLDSNLAQDVPLVGNKLADAASFLREMRYGLLGDLREKLSGDGKAIEYIQETLLNVLGPNNLGLLLDLNGDSQITIDDVQVGWYDAAGQWMQDWSVGGELPDNADAIQFNMQLGGDIYGDCIDIPLDIDLPGFELEVDGGFALDMG
ncbi:MAG: DUF4347 domain-containing protein, partial [Leptolyngbyaceae cyanobacterium MAG.088]|nr:DUF4347 domain-containing protein [Leptolyngbyaceae cyanobacterium MAG.088]